MLVHQTRIRRLADALERWLEAERDQLPLWLPVAFGAGIASWFVLPGPGGWIAAMLAGLALLLAGFAVRTWRRTGRALAWAGLMLAAGMGHIWWKAERVASPVLERPGVHTFQARILAAERRPAEGDTRFQLAILDAPQLPPRVRLNVPDGLTRRAPLPGETWRFRARLVPPPPPLVPGGYDFRRAAWFARIGAVGRALDLAPVAAGPDGERTLRMRLSDHVRSRLGGSEGGIASAFASGERGGIAPEVEEAMRASGLTHLLSISGLHITAVVAGAMFASLRLLALWPWLALRAPLLALSAGVGASAGIGYTLLTGAEVPTVRSCIAALLVLLGMAMGREAMTLRLVAAGALAVLLVWPESLVGASFQLSFAAITAIVALHDAGWVKKLLQRREEGMARRLGRALLGLLLTGLAVEAALAPIALFHFHKSGLYGAAANIVAIPLVTFVIMPLEALALALDAVGLGGPFWWLTGKALSGLIALAQMVAALPGAQTAIAELPPLAFALMMAGGLWMLLWRTRIRLAGMLLLLAGSALALAARPPDLLITGDGRHMAVRGADGDWRLLRERTGDFVRDALAERGGTLAPMAPFDTQRSARCSRDACVIALRAGGRNWIVAATRSSYRLPWRDLTAFCARSDIVASDRTLPKGCTPRWLKADRRYLAASGGLAISLSPPRIDRVNDSRRRHPWLRPPPPSGEKAQ